MNRTVGTACGTDRPSSACRPDARGGAGRRRRPRARSRCPPARRTGRPIVGVEHEALRAGHSRRSTASRRPTVVGCAGGRAETPRRRPPRPDRRPRRSRGSTSDCCRRRRAASSRLTAQHRRRQVRPAQQRPAHLLGHHADLDRTGAGAAVLLGHQPGPAGPSRPTRAQAPSVGTGVGGHQLGAPRHSRRAPAAVRPQLRADAASRRISRSIAVKASRAGSRTGWRRTTARHRALGSNQVEPVERARARVSTSHGTPGLPQPLAHRRGPRRGTGPVSRRRSRPAAGPPDRCAGPAPATCGSAPPR